MRIEVSEVTVVDDDLVDAFARLIPQLSSSNPPPDAVALQAIVDDPNTYVLVARDAD